MNGSVISLLFIIGFRLFFRVSNKSRLAVHTVDEFAVGHNDEQTGDDTEVHGKYKSHNRCRSERASSLT